jgi:hypothetical protein
MNRFQHAARVRWRAVVWAADTADFVGLQQDLPGSALRLHTAGS